MFDELGIVMVKIGTLESFSRRYDAMPRKGLGWLRAALQAGVHRSDQAIEHARRLVQIVSPADARK
jgi:hypothetical protein